MKNKIVLLIILLLCFMNGSAQIKVVDNPIHIKHAVPLNERELDSLVQLTMKTFDVPGISLGIIKEGKTIYAKGYGLAAIDYKKNMDAETLVGIASNSKGFTCTALAILVDEGKLNWDDKVTQYIPEFEMYDRNLTNRVTVRDLITHRAGLGLGQGDLMFFPDGGTLSINDIVHRVKYLKPENRFRNQLDYNNIMFIIAGEVITRITGKTWAEFIEERILQPVGMHSSFGSYNRAIASGVTNIIAPHAPVNGKIKQVPHDWNETANAAGGIVSNIPDMLVWAKFLMNDFTTTEGLKLVSDKQIQQLWQIQQPRTIRRPNDYNTHFYGYGLGWFLSDVNGYFQVQHTGGLIGTVTQFTLLPDLDLGIVVLTNQQSGAAFSSITNSIKDSYLGYPNRNWVNKKGERMQKYATYIQKQKRKIWKEVERFKKSDKALKYNEISGIYNDPWFGNISIIKQGRKMRIYSETSPRLKGELLPYSENQMVVKWDDRSYDADVFMKFIRNEQGEIIAAKLNPISEITDFSFDFDDLHLKKL